MKHLMGQIVGKRIVDSDSLVYFGLFLCRGPKTWWNNSRQTNSLSNNAFLRKKIEKKPNNSNRNIYCPEIVKRSHLLVQIHESSVGSLFFSTLIANCLLKFSNLFGDGILQELMTLPSGSISLICSTNGDGNFKKQRCNQAKDKPSFSPESPMTAPSQHCPLTTTVLQTLQNS